MKIDLEINNIVRAPISRSFFLKVAKKTLDNEKEFLDGRRVGLSLAIVSEEEIQALNKRYRRKNQATDVLSFAEFRNRRQIGEWAEEEIFLGEIILCYHDIEKYSGKKKIDFEKELAKVFSHGLLHLLGRVHGKKMFSLQDEVAEKISSWK